MPYVQERSVRTDNVGFENRRSFHVEWVKSDPTASVRLFLSVESAAAHNKRNDIYPGDFEATFPWQTMFTKDHVVPRRIDNAVKAVELFGNRIIQSNYLRALRFVQDEKRQTESQNKTHFPHREHDGSTSTMQRGFYMRIDSSHISLQDFLLITVSKEKASFITNIIVTNNYI